MILDTDRDPVAKIYLRELLDHSSSKFEHSKLSALNKMDIINALGLESLTKGLDKCFREIGSTYDIEDETRFA